MLCSVETLEGCSIVAPDGAIGHVDDVLFDDGSWVIRHLVIDCGHWLPGRKVLIPPRSVERLDWAEHELGVAMTKDQVRDSPDIDFARPVLRQHEAPLAGHDGYADHRYSGVAPEGFLPGNGGFGSPEAIREAEESAGSAFAGSRADDDPYLRSYREVTGYRIHTNEGDFGRIDGLLVDDRTWAIRYLVVDTSRFSIGHRALVAPSWISDVSRADATVSVRLSREAIRTAPPYDADANLSGSQEAELRQHFERIERLEEEPLPYR